MDSSMRWSSTCIICEVISNVYSWTLNILSQGAEKRSEDTNLNLYMLSLLKEPQTDIYLLQNFSKLTWCSSWNHSYCKTMKCSSSIVNNIDADSCASSQVLSRYVITLFLPEYSGLSTIKLNKTNKLQISLELKSLGCLSKLTKIK